MKKIIRDYFTFNKRERNGVFVLISIIVLLLVYLNISHLFIKREIVDFSKFEKEIEVLNASVQSTNGSSEELSVFNVIPEVKDKVEFFYFDPNNLSEENWAKLGLTAKQIRVIKNYESKGGKFKTKDDVKKMYCIKEAQYLLLESYIQIQEKEQLVKKDNIQLANSTDRITSKQLILELNSADSISLTKLKGIGAFYAKTIIKYRNSLGGFVNKEQLLEVWKFDQAKLDEIRGQITVEASKISKININSCTAQQLKHPYLQWNVVNAIINYRNKHGNYKMVDDIKKTDLVDEETFRKIEPYLIVDL